MRTLPIPSASYLQECFRYEGGALFWLFRPDSHFSSKHVAKMWNSKNAGKRAGRKMFDQEYRQIGLDGVRYLEHRIIAAIHGLALDGVIDHKNRDAGDNSVENLRPATQQKNSYNSTPRAGRDLPKGVCFCRSKQKYVAYIAADGSHTHLGTFSTVQDAKDARQRAEIVRHGDFSSIASQARRDLQEGAAA